MKKFAAVLALVVFFTLAPELAYSSTPALTPARATMTSEPTTQTRLFKSSPSAASTKGSANTDKTFRVNDEKGLLMTCIAPQIDTNPETDIFNNCALAPGRTLEDVMHTFIQAIHFVQDQQAKERAEWLKDLEERSGQKAAEK
jgi:hypothetical protein